MKLWRRRQAPESATSPPSSPVEASGKRAIAAGGDISGIASTGAQATNVLYQAEHTTVLPEAALVPPAAVEAPPALINLPARPGLFVGRAEALCRLDAALPATGGVVVQALHGLGGVGKSTLAAYWAGLHAAEHSSIWWIAADTPAALDAGLAALAVTLQPALGWCPAVGGVAGAGGAVAGRPPQLAGRSPARSPHRLSLALVPQRSTL